MAQNSHQIRLTGSFEIPNALEIDISYPFVFEGDVISISKHSNENGEYEFVYKIKPLNGSVIMESGQKVIKLIDKKKQSVKLRAQLAAIALDRGLEPEAFYEATLVKFRHYTMEILDFLEGLE